VVPQALQGHAAGYGHKGGAVDGDHRDHDAPVGGVALSNLEATPQLQPGEEVHRTRGGSVIGLPFREKHASPNG
jgi:hypothetical protein